MARNFLSRFGRQSRSRKPLGSITRKWARKRSLNFVDLRMEHLEDRCLLAAGDFDTAFNPTATLPPGTLLPPGTQGIVISHVGGATAQVNANSVVALPSGKILVGGYYQTTGSVLTRDFAVLRYNSDGTLDTTFGTGDADGINGLAAIAVTATQDIGYDLAVDSVGRIIIVGQAQNLGDLAVARLTSSGALDATFGTGGIVLTDFGATVTAEPRAVAIDASDNIVVAGWVHPNVGGDDFLVARYTTAGVLDSSFDTDGIVTTGFVAGNLDQALDVAIQTDGRIVVGGTITPAVGSRDWGLVRYNTNGSLDATFGTAGKVVTAVTTGTDQVDAVAVDSTGRIIAAGFSSLGFSVIGRYSSTGLLDTAGFNPGGPFPGTLRINVDISNDEFSLGLALQPDGKYVVAGLDRVGADDRLEIARVTSGGLLDTTFKSGGPTPGAVITNVYSGSSSERFSDVVIQADGKILAAGTANNNDLIMARYESGLLTAEADGPYTINEPGGSVVLNGSAVGTGPLTYAWDLDGDNIFGETGGAALYGDENLQNPTFTATGIDGPMVFNVKLRVTNPSQTAEDTSTVTVLNVAPTATLANNGPVNEGSTANVSFSGQFDPSPADTLAGFHYSYDFNNDGTWEIGNGTYAGSVVTASAVVLASFLNDGPANVTVKGRIIDDDGGFTDYTTVITVNNVAPTLTISGAASVNEGALYTLNLSSLDPGADTITSWTISWGDGPAQLVSGNPASVTHTYADGLNNYTVSATATDEDGTFSSNSIGVTVNNVAPTLTISGAASVNEGALYTLNLSSLDPGADTITSWTISWGDGPAQLVSGNPASVTHTYADGLNNYTVSATATDEDGTFSSNSIGVTVNNVAPTLTISGAASVNEGALYTLNLSSLDPGADTITSWTISWGDGPAQLVSGNPASVTHTYADGLNNYTVSATATDEDGTFSSNSIGVTVNNVAPTLTISGAASVNEGALYTLNLSSLDPGADTITSWTISWGDGPAQLVSGNPASVTHTYADGLNNYTVSATATDEDGTFSSNSIGVTVNNVAPTLTISGAASVNEGALYTLNLSSLDPGADTITSWTISWGDGPAQLVSGNPASVTHTYADGLNNYTVSATATDEDGTFSSNSIGVTVNNVAPTLTISGAASVNEGALYTLNLSSLDPGADTITSWTISWGDGPAQLVSGNPASVTHTYADGGNPSTNRTITATATDEDGTYSSNSKVVTVFNVAPTADAGGPYLTFDDTPITLSGTATDPAGAADPLTFTWDLDGDNIFGETGAGATRGNETGANPVFNPTDLSGSVTVTLRVSDGDGGLGTDTATVQVLSQGTLLIDGVLYIVGGNTSNDIVFISRCNNTISVCATFNSNNPVTFNSADVTDIQVRTRGGNDIVITTPNVTQSMTIDGGANNDFLLGGGGRNLILGGSGNDALYGDGGDDVLLGGTGNDDLFGGSGNDVLVGGDGNDYLCGGSGRDLIIGSQDNDTLQGGDDEDILIGGYTIHDNNVAALDAVMAIWTSSSSFSARVAALTASGGLLQAGVAVFDDGDHDTIDGGAGRDLYFGDITGQDKDALTIQQTLDSLVVVD